jgi:hypothetical protein
MDARAGRRARLAVGITLATIVWAVVFVVAPTLGLLLLVATGVIAVWLRLRRPARSGADERL